MQNRAQMKESKCAKDILKCANENCRPYREGGKVQINFLISQLFACWVIFHAFVVI